MSSESVLHTLKFHFAREKKEAKLEMGLVFNHISSVAIHRILMFRL